MANNIIYLNIYFFAGWDPVPEQRPECQQILAELEALHQTYLAVRDDWDKVRVKPPDGMKRQQYMSRTESMRFPLCRDDMRDLNGFENITISDTPPPDQSSSSST